MAVRRERPTGRSSYSRRESFERRLSCERTVCRPDPTSEFVCFFWRGSLHCELARWSAKIQKQPCWEHLQQLISSCIGLLVRKLSCLVRFKNSAAVFAAEFFCSANSTKKFRLRALLVKLVTFDIILVVLIFWGRLPAQLTCGEKCPVYAQIISGNNGEWMTKIT